MEGLLLPRGCCKNAGTGVIVRLVLGLLMLPPTQLSQTAKLKCTALVGYGFSGGAAGYMNDGAEDVASGESAVGLDTSLGQ
jgi:hypothetical protein